MKPLLTIYVFVAIVLAFAQPSPSFAKQSSGSKYSFAYLDSVSNKAKGEGNLARHKVDSLCYAALTLNSSPKGERLPEAPALSST